MLENGLENAADRRIDLPDTDAARSGADRANKNFLKTGVLFLSLLRINKQRKKKVEIKWKTRR